MKLVELTSASISISLRFDTALSQFTEVLLLGETASTVYINNSRKVSKNYYIAPDRRITVGHSHQQVQTLEVQIFWC